METTEYGSSVEKQTLNRTLVELAGAVGRHRRAALICFVAIFAAAIVYGLVAPKRYQAEMKILVKRERMNPVVTADSAQPQLARTAVTEEELYSEVELLRSRDLLQKVVTDAGLYAPSRSPVLSAGLGTPGGTPQANASSVLKAFKDLETNLKVQPIKKTNMISVTYESSDPVQSSHVLNVLARAYEEKHLAVHGSPGAFEFFRKEAERYRVARESAQGELTRFSRGEQLWDSTTEKQMALQRSGEFESVLAQTRVSIAETERRVRDLQAQLASTPERQTTQIREAGNAALLQQMKSNLLTLQLKHADMARKYQPNYPPLRDLDAQIAQTTSSIAEAERSPVRDETSDRNAVYAWLENELAKSRADLVTLRARASATENAVASFRDKTARVTEKGIVQADLALSAKAAEENYLLYLRKQEEARISDALDVDRIVNVAIAEPATPPSIPSFPRWSWLLGLATVFATTGSVGIAVLLDRNDPRFRTPEQAASDLDLPVLATMSATRTR